MTIPVSKTLNITAPAVGTTADDTNPIGVVDFAGTVTSVIYIPKASQNGAATNNRTLQVINRGAAGTGTVSVASLQLVSGTNLTDNVPTTITLASGSALTVASGDVLDWVSTHISTGVADPGGQVFVKFSRTVA